MSDFAGIKWNSAGADTGLPHGESEEGGEMVLSLFFLKIEITVWCVRAKY